jgi:hypothetical protein
MECPGTAAGPPGPSEALFVPASSHLVKSGNESGVRDWIVLGVLNGLVVAMSHLIFSFYIFLGPLAFFMQFFHQSAENLLIASVYLLMPITAPRRMPFTLNGVVWSAMGIMQGWWFVLPVAAPAGVLADTFLRRSRLKSRGTSLLIGFTFYTAMLGIASFWPFMFMKQSAMIRRMIAMDPGIASYIDTFTFPFFIAIMASAAITGLLGGHMALRFIARHFAGDELS